MSQDVGSSQDASILAVPGCWPPKPGGPKGGLWAIGVQFFTPSGSKGAPGSQANILVLQDVLREFGENSRHPDPRPVRNGGPELHILTSHCVDCVDQVDPGNPRMNS